ncbi:MAG: tryptophan-rich sensory protein [Clostridia bacterium]|nr:tryptophan-rich sensory protein [Clostridia bacterium]
MWKKLKPYVISVLIALGVGGLSALLTSGNMNIYDKIISPPLSPPGILFPIVWTVLYTLMGISSALVYAKGKEEDIDTSSALGIYLIQLAVNFFWSIIFFNLQAYLFAFIWIILLWILIITMIKRFYEISPLAAYLQIPYLLWVTFAAYLNLAIYILNR